MLNTPFLRCLLGTALWLLLLGGAAAQVDPPGRVARINQFEGAVSFAPAGTDDWAYAQINRPLTGGDRLWVDAGGRAELHVGSAALRVNEQTSLGFVELDDDTATIKVTQGTVSLRVRSLPREQHYEIQTPNLAFVPNAPGEYRLDVAPDGSTTNIAIREGSGIAYGEDGAGTPIPGRQQVRFAGRRLTPAGASNALPGDSFEGWVTNRDRAEDASISARYVPREVIGYQQLDDNGTWQETAEYGPVWTPRVVAAGWAPYRTGHWAWIRPWGWTWIDDAPWGFAPYHYGRWAYFGNRWCWVPGRHIHTARPVYAPALVAFIGGSGASLTLSFGSMRSSGVAWFPLAPGEVYRPAYRASPRYINNVNRTTVINQTTINNVIVNNTTVNKTVYVNQRAPNAVTAVPSTAFVRGQAVAPVARPLARQDLVKALVVSAAPAVTPVKQSLLGDARPARRPLAAALSSSAPIAVSPGARKELHAEPALRQGIPEKLAAERPAAVAAPQAARMPTPQGRLGGAAAAAAGKDVPGATPPLANHVQNGHPRPAEEKRVFEGVRKLDGQVAPAHSMAPQVLRGEPSRTAPVRPDVAPAVSRTEVPPARHEGDRRPAEPAKPPVAVQAPHPAATSPATRNESPHAPAFRPNRPAADREEAVSFSGKGREDRRQAPETRASAPAAAVAPSRRPSLPEVIVKRPEVQIARPPGNTAEAHGRGAGDGRSGKNEAAASHHKPAEAPRRREEGARPDAPR